MFVWDGAGGVGDDVGILFRESGFLLMDMTCLFGSMSHKTF